MSQIPWHAWSDDVFAQAQVQNKPVLLSIQAPWCHWCRVMDEQTYQNEAIAQYVSEHFVAVRVDSDKRPDVNARYTMGGWPSTSLLSPEGDLIWGSTFVPPDAMAQLLPQVLNAFHNEKQNMAQHIIQQREKVKAQTTMPPLDVSLPVSPLITQNAVNGVKQNFDFAHGGFGREQKFPHVDALELCLEQYARSIASHPPDADLRLILDKTLAGMAGGGLHDREPDGGFFRYTQTPDWREPQFEKLLEDNALLARVYTRAFQLLGDEAHKEVAAKTLRYLDTTLYDTARGTWGASQAADSEYYAQPVAERAEWNPPAVDKTVLCGPNALVVRAHVAWWQATGEETSLLKAKRGLDFLLTLREDGGGFAHFLPTSDADAQAAGRVPSGLLADAADVCAACLDLYEAGQGASYLDHAEDTAEWVRGHLEDPQSGGLFDAVTRPDAVGNMKVGTKDLPDNMQMADALLRLFLATGEEEHARLAQRILQAFLPASPQLGFFGAGFGFAAERALLAPILVHVLGDPTDERTRALLSAAHRPYRFERFVQPLDPANADDADHLESLGYPVPTEPIAYVCVAAKCLPPTSDPARLSELVREAA